MRLTFFPLNYGHEIMDNYSFYYSTAVDKKNGFVIQCVDFSRSLSSYIVEPCNSNPCLNGGICSGSVTAGTTTTSYSCACEGVWGGQRCEVGEYYQMNSVIQLQYPFRNKIFVHAKED